MKLFATFRRVYRISVRSQCLRYATFSIVVFIGRFGLGVAQNSTLPNAPYPPIGDHDVRMAANATSLPKMPRPYSTSVFPLFLQDATHTSTVMLTNSAASAYRLTLTVQDVAGKEQPPYEFGIAGHSQIRVDLQTVLSRIHSAITIGSIRLSHDSMPLPSGVVGQMTLVSRHGSTNSLINEELQMPSTSSSHILRAVGEATELSPLLAVVNLSAQTQTVAINCRWGSTNSEHNITLLPDGLTVLDPCNGHRHRPQASAEPFQVSIQANGAPGSFGAFGITRHRRNHNLYDGSLAFVDPLEIRSQTSVFSGVSTPSQRELGASSLRVALANFDAVDVRVHIDIVSTAANERVSIHTIPVSLRKHSTEQISLERFRIRPDESASVLITSSAPPGRVVSKVFTTYQDPPFQVEQLAKDADSNLNGGSHPWSTGAEQSSALILFNHTSSPQPLNIVVANSTGVESKRRIVLAPRETREIPLTEIIAHNAPDGIEKSPLSNADSGMVMWHSRGPGEVSGRVLQRNKNSASAVSFSCGDVWYLCSDVMSYEEDPMGIGTTQFIEAIGVYCMDDWGGYCDGNISYEDNAYLQDWYSSDTSVVSLSDSGISSTLATGNQAGNAYIITDLYDQYACAVTDYLAMQVQPIISSSNGNDLWYFDGLTQSGYINSITLTSNAGSSTTWRISSGSSNISLSATSGSSITVTIPSSPTSFSSSPGDSQVLATSAGIDSQPYLITTHKPYNLEPETITDACDGTFGYESVITYTIEDQLGTTMPSAVDVNEYWSTSVVSDYSGTNWRRGPANGFNTGSTYPSTFQDVIQGEVSSMTPTPNCPGELGPGNVAVNHWGQNWSVGSTTPGSGHLVQTDTLQKYQDHARHTGITTDF